MLWLSLSVLLFASLTAARASMTLGPWTPIYKGVDFARGTNTIDATFPRRQAVFVMRLDLTDPDLELFTDPPCATCAGSAETKGSKTSTFLATYKLQGAVNYSFFPECCSYPEGTPMNPFGLLISQGVTVSPDWTTSDYDSRNGQTYYSVLMFDAFKTPTFIAYNWPATNTAAIHTAIAGSRAILSDGETIIVWGDSVIDPRVAIGLSEDGQYLFLLTIDGRQPGYSDGANDRELGLWLKLAGAWNALNVDGGGSTTMVRSESCGRAVQVNRPIQDGVPGKERVVAAHFGFRAKPLPGFINEVMVQSGMTNANVTWTTLEESTSRVEYGLTANYGSSSPLDSSLTTNHAVQLTGLKPGTNYYIRVLSQTAPNQQYWADSCFVTTNNVIMGTVFDLVHEWSYSTQNLDGIHWQAIHYDDSRWPSGPGLLCVENNPLVNPKNTFLPANPNTNDPLDPSTWDPYITYYFRTHFDFTNDPAEASLIFSNYLDDGAVFSLNGVELFRAFMPEAPAVITNSTLASYYYCRDTGDATCPYVTNISGALITNLVQGDNVLAVEVHNYNAGSPDLVFGTALLFTAPPPPPKSFLENLTIQAAETSATITWTTASNATTLVEYGLTATYDLSTPLDSGLVTNHTVVLADLQPGQTYYFQAKSSFGTNEYSARGFFATVAYYQPLVALTNTWRYTTNNLQASNWMAVGYPETGWRGPSRALLHVENNPDVYPKNTTMPNSAGRVYPTYYFRAHFTLTNSPVGLALSFTNLVDDGAVFYLNGREIQRLRMPPAPLPMAYTNLATEEPPFGDAIYPDLFRISGDLMTNLVVGDNVLAAEVHQYTATNSDVVFGTAVGLVRALAAETKLRVSSAEGAVGIAWDGLNFVLQQSPKLGPTNAWTDVSGPVRFSPYTLTNPAGSVFFRLRNSGGY